MSGFTSAQTLRGWETRRKNKTDKGHKFKRPEDFGKKIWEIRKKNGTESIDKTWSTRRINGTDKATKETKDKMRISAIKRVIRLGATFKPSILSTKILNELEEIMNIKIEREYPIYDKEYGLKFYDGRWKKLLIEIDGKYWHDKPGAIENDKTKDIIAKRFGYKLERIRV